MSPGDLPNLPYISRCGAKALVMGAKLRTWMTLAPLNVGFGADVGANRRGGLLDLLGGLEFEFLAGDHRLGGRVEFVGDVAQVGRRTCEYRLSPW